jgi:uncharacterized protein (DUF3084 family)
LQLENHDLTNERDCLRYELKNASESLAAAKEERKCAENELSQVKREKQSLENDLNELRGTIVDAEQLMNQELA